LIPLAVLLAYSLLPWISCSKKEPVTSKPAVPEKRDPVVRVEGNKTIITNVESSGELVLGVTDEVPEGFPKDVPVLPDCEVNNVVKAEQNMLFTTFFTSKSLDEVKDFYIKESHFEEAGWKVEDAHQVPTG